MMDNEGIKLPEPRYSGGISVEEAINRRRSVRDFTDEALTLAEVSQLLWACSGKTFDGTTGASRAYPSAGGLYPLEVYLVAGDVERLEKGFYNYNWKDHSIRLVRSGDYQKDLSQAALDQRFVREAPICIIITALYERTGRIYGDRGIIRYVHMDSGHAAQNIYLEAVSLNLGAVAVGAFNDERVKRVLGLEREEPLYIMPVGHPLK